MVICIKRNDFLLYRVRNPNIRTHQILNDLNVMLSINAHYLVIFIQTQIDTVHNSQFNRNVSHVIGNKSNSKTQALIVRLFPFFLFVI